MTAFTKPGHAIALICGLAIATSASAAVPSMVGTANGPTRTEACQRARDHATYLVNSRRWNVTRYGQCDCSERTEESQGSGMRWVCSIEAFYDTDS